jgi:putative DNA primase/helicase
MKDQLPLIIPAEFITGDLVRRTAHNVLNITMGVLDLDKGSAADQKLTLEIVKTYGHFVHTSFSHDPNGQHKRRAFVKFSRPVAVTEWKAFFPRMLVHFQATAIADWKCADPPHMYFVPGGDYAKYEAYGVDGPGLDVDEVLALALPEGVVEKKIENYQPDLPEDERGEIGDGLRELWEAKLTHLADDIEARPYPAPIYDLKVHQVFGLARGVPHIMSAERLRNVVTVALDRRYRTGDPDAVAVDRAKSVEQIDKAITNGSMQPWYPPKSNVGHVRPFTEVGLAERLVDQHKQDIRWEPNWRSWVGWNGKYWSQDAGGEVVQKKMIETLREITKEASALAEDYVVAKKSYEAMKDDPNVSAELIVQTEFLYERLKKQLEEIEKFALRSETNSKVGGAIHLATCYPEVLTSHLQFNKNPWLVNFLNGTLDLRTGELGPHRREDYITRIVPYAFDPDAECPSFNHFMDSFMCGNERLIKFLWRAMGYTACGVTDEQKILILYGDGANGKSTFLNLMLEVFGQGSTGYGMAANSENLLSNKGGSRHETWRMSLASVRFVPCQEVDEGRTLAESMLKELTGSDVITGRKLYQNEWSYKPEFTLWLAINHLPHVRGTDEGIWRRLCVIPCNASFKDAPDRDMPRRLAREIPGVWARIAREARLWLKERLVLPREIIVSNTLYRHEQDPLRDFVERWCITAGDAVETRPTLWAAYEEYCAEYKVRTFHERKRFYAALEKQHGTKKVHGERFFTGIRVKTPKERIESLPKAILQRALKEREKPN